MVQKAQLAPNTLGGIVQTLRRARLPIPIAPAEFTQCALKKYVENVASRPYTGPLNKEASEMLERDYGRKKMKALIIALAQVHTGRITKNMVVGQAHRLGLSGHIERRKRLLKA